MAVLGVNLTLMIGPTIAVPAPPELVENLERAEVTTSDSGRSGFQLVFAAGRADRSDLVDFSLLRQPLLLPFRRVVLVVTFGGTPRVLMDGIITHRELTPSSTPGETRITVTGEDVSVMMDLEEKTVEHPAQGEAAIATMLIAAYSTYGLIPDVVSPASLDIPTPVERVPVQQGTDLEYLITIAARFGFVFYVTPGPAPMANKAYWGPQVRTGAPQRALSVDLGADTNVEQVTFRSDGLASIQVTGQVQDRVTNRSMPVRSVGDLRPPLAAKPDWRVNLPNVRTKVFRDSGLSGLSAQARVQGEAEASHYSLTVTGSMDGLRYGEVLRARQLVGLRGAGYDHDGLYYVKRVSHSLRTGSYTQSFTLTREGLGSTVAAVPA